MGKSDSKKRAETMAKEWKKSRCTTRSLNGLIEMGLLHNQELGGWRAPEGESYPDPQAFSLGFTSLLRDRDLQSAPELYSSRGDLHSPL